MILLGQGVILFFQGTDSLVEHLNRVFKSMSVGKPILFLEFLHALEVELRDAWGSILALGVLVLDPPRDGVDRGIHELVEFDSVGVLHLLMVINAHEAYTASVVIWWQRAFVSLAFL